MKIKRRAKFTSKQRAGMEFEGLTRAKPLPALSQDFFSGTVALFFLISGVFLRL